MVQVGDRIRLNRMGNDPDPVAPGTEGTVNFVNNDRQYPQVGVIWDNGRSLMLIPGEDSFSVIPAGS